MANIVYRNGVPTLSLRTWDDLGSRDYLNLLKTGSISGSGSIGGSGDIWLGANPKIEVPMSSFMTDGPGRFITAANFSGVDKFFSSSVPQGRYTITDLKNNFSYTDSDFTTTASQWAHPGLTDYIERAFVYGNAGYKLDSQIVFVSDASGLHVENVAIKVFDDDFNFETASNDYFSQAFNAVFEALFGDVPDGRAVGISYRDAGGTPGSGRNDGTVTADEYGMLVTARAPVTEALTYCFLAGTEIDTPHGKKAIEEITDRDVVLCFDENEEKGRGQLLSSKVVRVFRKSSDDLLDFHGVKTTSGHLFLSENGRFSRLSDIISADEVVINEDGAPVRARTGQLVGSENDRAIPVSIGKEHLVLLLRAGVPYGQLAAEGPILTLSAKMSYHGYRLRDDGLFENATGDVRMAAWEWGDPREHPVARNYVVGEPYEIAEPETVN